MRNAALSIYVDSCAGCIAGESGGRAAIWVDLTRGPRREWSLFAQVFPTGSENQRALRVGFNLLAKPSGNDRNWRTVVDWPCQRNVRF